MNDLVSVVVPIYNVRDYLATADTTSTNSPHGSG